MPRKHIFGLRSKQAASLPPAKLTAPSPRNSYLRTRLFKLLDRARKHPVVWITAPGGSGKTTLVASYVKARKVPTFWYQIDPSDSDPASFFYCLGQGARALAPKKKPALPLLTPEYHAALPVFTANYFRSFFDSLKPGSVVVFDNYQDAATPYSPLHDLLAQGIEQIPKGINVVVISREEPPSAYARHRANERLALIDWDAMRLTEREAIEIAKLHDRDARFSPAMLKALHQETQGWVAGIVLLAERANTKRIEPPIHDPTATQPVFDYFAAEIFRRGEPSTREFLLKTAFLLQLSPTLAQALTGEEESESILKDLARRNFFTLRLANDIYEYHPLFRVFLLSEVAKIYTTQELSDLKRRAGELLAKHGDAPAAIVLLQDAQDWAGALALVVAQAPLLAGQGRIQTLESWLNAFPPAIAENPWVLYWKGVCRIGSSPGEARNYFEHAFSLFEQQEDASPLCLAWAGIVQSIVFENDDFTPLGSWLDRYPTLTQGRKAPSREIEAASVFAYVSGMVQVRFEDPTLPEHVRIAERFLQEDKNPSRRVACVIPLILYYFWRGEITKVKSLLQDVAVDAESPEATPLARLYWYFCKMIYAMLYTGDLVHLEDEALALAAEHGIHVLDFQFLAWGVWYQLCRLNDIAAARQRLQRMQPHARLSRIRSASYHLRVATVLLHEGNGDLALKEAQQALQLCQETGFWVEKTAAHATLASIQSFRRDFDAASAHVDELKAIAQKYQSKFFGCVYLHARAHLLYARGEMTSALDSLRESLTAIMELTDGSGLSAPPYYRAEDVAALHALALDANICTDYVRRMIATADLPPPPGYLSDKWPWQVRLYTLGRFEIFVNDVPLTFGRKAQRKPLDLLRAMIALGGRNVSAEKLKETLWPDAEGDAARHALDTTVYRLRKVLGDQCIAMYEGLLSFDAQCCWIDVWALEKMLEMNEKTTSLTAQIQYLLQLYRGPFLDDGDSPLILLRRERLRLTFRRTIERFGELLYEQGDYGSAAACYERGIEVDPLAEVLYRHLMDCYRRLDRISAALAAYQRCERMLSSVLGTAPSSEMKALYEAIQRRSS